jgi:TP901 family phage tail tape measure protein
VAERAGGGYVDLEPRLASGFESKIQKDLDPVLKRVGSKVSSVGSTLSKGLTLPILAGAGALGAAALTIDDALDTIAIKSGATGEQLAGLEGSFRKVAAQVPNDVGEVATAIGLLHARTGQTGPDLEALAQTTLTYARLTKQDLGAAIEGTTRLFGDWSIATGQQAKTLDFLFTLSQKTGVGVDFLSEKVVQFGGPLRQLGFSFENSAALIAKFQKEGVNTELVMGSMRIALGKMARAGEEPIGTFKRVVGEIKNAGDAGTANAKALELFGARAGPDMAAAIREGRFEIGSLLDSLGNTDGALSKTAKQTDDFGEKLKIFKNRIILAVEPLAKKLIDAVNGLMPKLEPILGFITQLVDRFTKLSPTWQVAIVAALGFAAALGPILSILGPIIALLGAILSPIGLIVVAVAAVAVGLYLAYQRFEGFRNVVQAVVEWVTGVAAPAIAAFAAVVIGKITEAVDWVKSIWPQISEAIGHVLNFVQGTIAGFVGAALGLWHLFGDDILHAAQAVWGTIAGVVNAALDIVRGIIQTVLAVINGDWGKAWDGLKQIVGGVWDGIFAIIRGAVGVIRSIIGGLASAISEAAHGMFDGIAHAFRSAINTVIRAWNGLQFKVPSVDAGPIHFGGQTIGAPDIPLLAAGGTAVRAGLAVVGDAGAEVLKLRRGDSVFPMDRVRSELEAMRNVDASQVHGSDGASAAMWSGDMYVNNPVPEKASDSVPRELRRLEYLLAR